MTVPFGGVEPLSPGGASAPVSRSVTATPSGRSGATIPRALKLVPPPLPESTVPAWRSRLVGVYTDADERAEREVLGWLLTGGRVPPFTLRAEHFASRWHRLLFTACGAVQLRDGAIHPVRVMACLRAHGHSAGVAAEIAELMSEACDVAHPPFIGRFVERAERRLKVLKLEREAEELRRELR